MTRPCMGEAAEHVDLVPLIDCVFLLLLFFMLCGRLASDQRDEQITVPPAVTGSAPAREMPRLVIGMRSGPVPALRFGCDPVWIPLDEPGAWAAVRRRLDTAWERAPHRTIDGLQVAEAAIEIRADADLPIREVQVLQQIACDALDPGTLLPRAAVRKPFTVIDLTARPAG